MPPPERISDVIVMQANGPLRMMLRLVLADDGYSVTEAPTYAAVLRHLRTATGPVVVVAGNLTPDYHAEVAFFAHIAADAELARRHRYVLLCTSPRSLPPSLQATLNRLGAPILQMPMHLPDLEEAVARVAEWTHAEGESAG
jgi:hypothetical protein